MTGVIFASVLGLLALSGSAVQAQDTAAPDARPGFSFWGTGSGSYTYHRLTGDCGTLEHGHGRNAAWGRWVMPISAVAEDGPEEGEHGGVGLRFRCLDGSSCIQRGRLTQITDQVDEHVIPFETMERARAFSRQVSDLKAACAAH